METVDRKKMIIRKTIVYSIEFYHLIIKFLYIIRDLVFSHKVMFYLVGTKIPAPSSMEEYHEFWMSILLHKQQYWTNHRLDCLMSCKYCDVNRDENGSELKIHPPEWMCKKLIKKIEWWFPFYNKKK